MKTPTLQQIQDNTSSGAVWSDTVKLVIMGIVLLLIFPSLGLTSSPLLTEANSFFSQAVDTENSAEAAILLDKALLRYEQLYRDQPSGRLAYNIGNTYYQMNDKPMALVFYKRAMVTIPSDSNLLHNMEFVRQKLQLENIADQTKTSWYPAFLTTNLLPIFLILYGLFWTTAIIRQVKKQMMPIAIPFCLFFLCLASSTIIGMALLQPASQTGVITSADIMGRQGNGRNFEPSFNEPLKPGSEFTILEKRGYWLRIQLDQGEECWVPSRSCEII